MTLADIPAVESSVVVASSDGVTVSLPDNPSQLAMADPDPLLQQRGRKLEDSDISQLPVSPREANNKSPTSGASVRAENVEEDV